MKMPEQQHFSHLLTQLLTQSGRGIIRKAMDTAIRMMGEQFVTGETMQAALAQAKPLEQRGFRYSNDMLRKAAFTAQDTKRYYQDDIARLRF